MAAQRTRQAHLLFCFYADSRIENEQWRTTFAHKCMRIKLSLATQLRRVNSGRHLRFWLHRDDRRGFSRPATVDLAVWHIRPRSVSERRWMHATSKEPHSMEWMPFERNGNHKNQCNNQYAYWDILVNEPRYDEPLLTIKKALPVSTTVADYTKAIQLS